MTKEELIKEIMWIAEFNSGASEEEQKVAFKNCVKLLDKYLNQKSNLYDFKGNEHFKFKTSTYGRVFDNDTNTWIEIE